MTAHPGGFDADEMFSIDGGPPQVTSGDPWVITFAFTDTNGDPQVEPFHFFFTGDGSTGVVGYFVPGPESAFTVDATQEAHISHTVGWDCADIICPARGTLVKAGDGQVPVEDPDRGGLRPVRVMAVTLGGGLPRRDLLVSRQHRMVVRSRSARRLFGQGEVLVWAIRLRALPGIFVDRAVQEVECLHLVPDRHQVIFAEGGPTESLYFAEAARAEIEALFGGNATVGPQTHAARMILPLPWQNRLIRRHLENHQGLVSA